MIWGVEAFSWFFPKLKKPSSVEGRVHVVLPVGGVVVGTKNAAAAVEHNRRAQSAPTTLLVRRAMTSAVGWYDCKYLLFSSST